MIVFLCTICLESPTVMLTNDVVSFEQLGPDLLFSNVSKRH